MTHDHDTAEAVSPMPLFFHCGDGELINVDQISRLQLQRAPSLSRLVLKDGKSDVLLTDEATGRLLAIMPVIDGTPDGYVSDGDEPSDDEPEDADGDEPSDDGPEDADGDEPSDDGQTDDNVSVSFGLNAA